jgi:hypothetical protein
MPRILIFHLWAILIVVGSAQSLNFELNHVKVITSCASHVPALSDILASFGILNSLSSGLELEDISLGIYMYSSWWLGCQSSLPSGCIVYSIFRCWAKSIHFISVVCYYCLVITPRPFFMLLCQFCLMSLLSVLCKSASNNLNYTALLGWP